MAVVQYFNLKGQALTQPIEAANYVRAPVVGDLVFARPSAAEPPERMQVVGAEHRSVQHGAGLVPALALFVAPYPGAGDSGVPDVPNSATLVLPNGH